MEFSSDKVSRNESQPNYAQGVQCDIDVFRFIETLWDFSSSKGKIGAEQYQEEVVGQSDGQPYNGRLSAPQLC